MNPSFPSSVRRAIRSIHTHGVARDAPREERSLGVTSAPPDSVRGRAEDAEASGAEVPGVLLSHPPGVYLRSPRLRALPEGGAELVVLAWRIGEGEARWAWRLDGAGRPVSGPEVLDPVPRPEGMEGLGEGWPPEPIARAEEDDVARAGAWQVEVRRQRGVSTVWVLLPDGRQVPVWRAAATAAAPALAPVPGGCWVAFHHDLREVDGERDLPKWVALRFVEERLGKVHEPAAGLPPDLDRDGTGEEQSFEFPSLVVGPGGAVGVLGRGSHRFWWQVISGAGWSRRRPLDAPGWGCRGRRATAALLARGDLLVAMRVREGIRLCMLPVPRGEVPALRGAVVAPASRARPPGRLRVEPPPGEELAPEPWRTLFGDVHQHSAHSDGLGTADEPYERARWAYGDDFCVLSDHESFLGKRTAPGEWRRLQRVAERHHAPAEGFLTIFAYEWTGRRFPGPGHKVVYLPEPGLPIVSRDEVSEGRELLERVAALGGFAVPHHVGWTGADAAAHDERLQPVWELCSCHGCYEHAEHPLGQRGALRDQLVVPMLRAGLRFGFVAGSDGHGLLWHHGVCRKRDAHRTGLTAVLLTEPSRRGWFEAVRARRCYATSGAKIRLWAEVGGLPMGALLPGAGQVRLRARVRGTGPIARLEVVGPSGVLAWAPGQGVEAALDADVVGPWVYVRAVQRDGEYAWASPFFWG